MKTSTRLHHRIVSTDPGLGKFYNGARSFLSFCLTLAVISIVGGTIGLSKATLVSYMIAGGVIAMMSPVLVTGNRLNDRKKTLLLFAPVSIGAMILGSLAAPYPLVGMILFLPFIFFAIFLKYFGAREQAFGMIAYISYFMTLMFHLPFDKLTELAGVSLIALVVAYVVRFVLLKENTHLTFASTLSGFHAHAGLLFEKLTQLNTSHLETRTVISLRNFEKLNDLAIDLHMQIQSGSWAPLSPDIVTQLKSAIFRIEVELEAISFYRISQSAAGADQKKAEHITCFLESFHVVEEFLEMLRQHEYKNLPRPGETNQTPSQTSRTNELLWFHLRLAAQATLAAIISMCLGWMISPQRWYWAVIASFVIFSSTSTRADVMNKAWERAAGTLTGVVLGLVAIHFIAGFHALELGGITVCIFLAFYSMKSGSFWLVFYFSFLFALLFDLLGAFSLPLMELRFFETTAGVLIGSLVSFFVFPNPTRKKVREAFARLFEKSSDLLNKLAALNGSEDATLLEDLRALDKVHAEVRALAAPMTRRISFLKRKASLRLMDETSRLLLIEHYLFAHIESLAENTPSETFQAHCLKVAETAKQMAATAKQLVAIKREPSSNPSIVAGDRTSASLLNQIQMRLHRIEYFVSRL